MEKKPILCVDFDACIHSYKSGWKGVDVIPDDPVPGVFMWLNAALRHFDVYVYSSRSSSVKGRDAMFEFIKKYGGDIATKLKYVARKPRAHLYIDDRAMCFNGDWFDPRYNPEELLAFKPWYKQ